MSGPGGTLEVRKWLIRLPPNVFLQFALSYNWQSSLAGQPLWALTSPRVVPPVWTSLLLQVIHAPRTVSELIAIPRLQGDLRR